MPRGALRSLFFKEEMELSLIGLNAAGKTSLVNVIAVRSCGAGRPPVRLSAQRLRGRTCAATHAACAAWVQRYGMQGAARSAGAALTYRLRRLAHSART